MSSSRIEAATDRVSLEGHALAKRAKDMGSAAVMIALVNVPVVWLLVLLPYRLAPAGLVIIGAGMTTLICGSIAYDTIMVFRDRFKNHILPDQLHILNVAFLVP